MSKNNFNGSYPAFFSTTPLKIMISIKVKKQNKKTRLVVLKAAAFYRQNDAGSRTLFHKGKFRTPIVTLFLEVIVVLATH